MASSGNDLSNNYLGNSRPVGNAAQRAAVTPAQFSQFQSITTLRAYLVAQGYTNAQLDVMTRNDLNFAARRKLAVPIGR